MQCYDLLLECESCLEEVGAPSRSLHPSVPELHHCRNCWVDWARRQHRHPQPVTVRLLTDDGVTVEVTDLSGKRVFAKSYVGEMKVEELRLAVAEAAEAGAEGPHQLTEVTELRLAKDGKFHDYSSFVDLMGAEVKEIRLLKSFKGEGKGSSCNCKGKGPQSPWQRAPRLLVCPARTARKIVLVSPDGQIWPDDTARTLGDMVS